MGLVKIPMMSKRFTLNPTHLRVPVLNSASTMWTNQSQRRRISHGEFYTGYNKGPWGDTQLQHKACAMSRYGNSPCGIALNILGSIHSSDRGAASKASEIASFLGIITQQHNIIFLIRPEHAEKEQMSTTWVLHPPVTIKQ